MIELQLLALLAMPLTGGIVLAVFGARRTQFGDERLHLCRLRLVEHRSDRFGTADRFQ